MKTYRLLEADDGYAIFECEQSGQRLVLKEGSVVEIYQGSLVSAAPKETHRNGMDS